MVLKVEDKDFHTFVSKNCFIPENRTAVYAPLLRRQNNETRNILEKGQFVYIQMGYGSGRDSEVKETAAYDDLKGRIQCRWTEPLVKAVADTAFEVNHELGRAIDSLNNVCQLRASDVNSTGTGDSGGPLFAIPLKDRTKFYLVGVTAGANYFVEQKYQNNPKTAPRDDHMHNNAATYWEKFFNVWPWD